LNIKLIPFGIIVLMVVVICMTQPKEGDVIHTENGMYQIQEGNKAVAIMPEDL